MIHIFELIKRKMLSIGAKHFDLWNRQLEGTQNNAQPFNYPAVFIDFQQIICKPEGNKNLRCAVDLKLYIGWQYYLENQKDKAIIGADGLIEFSRKVTQVLHGYRDTNVYTFSQRSFRSDSRFSNVYTMEMDFVTEYVEDIARPILQPINPTPLLKIEPVAYIDSL